MNLIFKKLFWIILNKVKLPEGVWSVPGQVKQSSNESFVLTGSSAETVQFKDNLGTETKQKPS